MTNRERMIAALSGNPCDRLPCIEWASWWDKTVKNWNLNMNQHQLFEYFGLDDGYQLWITPKNSVLSPKTHGGAVIDSIKEFRENLSNLYTEDRFKSIDNFAKTLKNRHDSGEIFIWYSLEGYFWYPRTLFGIEGHLYAFYDEPELMLEINENLLKYYEKSLDILYSTLTPEFMTFAEDMSYNHGPMLSKEHYDIFMAPFYNKLIPKIKQTGTKVLIDTDGDVEPLIPWFIECGIDGVLPLERMAGVDVKRIRKNYPDFILLGGFDKTVMKNGESAMRSEFERIFPAIKKGKYIPSVDHQTPPDVSEENYKIYVKLLLEYTKLK